MSRPTAKCFLVFALLASFLSIAHAQGERPLPITNGTSQTRMDAPEKNSELESYTHSPMVQSLARHMGVSTAQAARYFEDFNSGVLILVALYYLFKIVPGKLRAKREGVDRDLAEARAATVDAQGRLERVEKQLAALGGEIELLRQQAAEGAKAEQARMEAALGEEKTRIVHQAELEIAAAQANAERGLRRFVSDLAVERATERVRLTPEGDRTIVDEFLRDLSGQFQGQN